MFGGYGAQELRRIALGRPRVLVGRTPPPYNRGLTGEWLGAWRRPYNAGYGGGKGVQAHRQGSRSSGPRTVAGSEAVRFQSINVIEGRKAECALIGTAMSALFQAETGHRGRNHGPHVFEAICGRAYNLGASAYLLTMSGSYDEASNLIRSLGEIGNIISLSVFDKALFKEWLEGDDEVRSKKFRPAQIRKAIRAARGIEIADDKWYKRFCEAYTHVTPVTKPGAHNSEGRCVAGGFYQEAGFSLTLEALANILGLTSMWVSKLFGFDDLFEEVVTIADSVSS